MQKVTGKETLQSVIESRSIFQETLSSQQRKKKQILVLNHFTFNIKFHLFN